MKDHVDRRSFGKSAVGVDGAAAVGAAAVSAGLPLLRPRQANASGWMYAAHRRGGPGVLGTPYVRSW